MAELLDLLQMVSLKSVLVHIPVKCSYHKLTRAVLRCLKALNIGGLASHSEYSAYSEYEANDGLCKP